MAENLVSHLNLRLFLWYVARRPGRKRTRAGDEAGHHHLKSKETFKGDRTGTSCSVTGPPPLSMRLLSRDGNGRGGEQKDVGESDHSLAWGALVLKRLVQ